MAATSGPKQFPFKEYDVETVVEKSTTPTNEEVRRQFEAWAVDRRMSVERDERHGYYLDDTTQDAWIGYQAALRSPAVAGLVDVLHELQESAAYWSDYDVPLGIADRIDAALAPFTTGAGHE
jgi:hypothetical protein